ncbi:MAG TPA: DMT family transporter [Kofleriaceae bacterium]|nr:DMT family transporter [Kofleriaceae bacterium]
MTQGAPALSRLTVHLLLIAAQLCFASLAVVGRMAVVAHVPPAGIVLVRMVGGALVFALIARARGVLRIERRDLRLFILCAVLGVVLNQELFIHGLARTAATNAVVLGSTIPVFTALFSIALGYEPWSRWRVAGIAVAFIGCLVLVGPDELSLSSSHLVGSVMVLANAASYGLYLALARKIAGRYDPWAIVAVLFLIGVPLVTPLGVVAWSTAPPLTGTTLAFLGFLVAVPTVAAYSLVQIGLRHAESSLVASYIYLQPVFTTIGATLLLDEPPGGQTLVAASIVLSGVWISAQAKAAVG